jgi:hypothetical protein
MIERPAYEEESTSHDDIMNKIQNLRKWPAEPKGKG